MAGPDQDNSPEVASTEQLEAFFHDGGKPRAAWKIGVEYEKPVVDAATGESVPYEGSNGIGRLLETMLERSEHWEGVYEDEHLIALRDGRASITLEPGGQFEMSGQQCDSLHCANEELRGHVEEIVGVGDELGLRFLGLGAVPKTPLARSPWMPKQRYRIMRRIMQTTGSLGLRMMQQTATVQCNFDYCDERDASRKMRLAMAMGPVLVAISANSPVIDGKPSGYQSYRAHIWSDTDPARCGMLPFVFETDSLFRAYTEYALDVPMYFIVRQNRLIEVGGMTFRRFLAEGFGPERATLADWSMHLTTLFPEVRLKTYIEVRSADSQPVELMLGTPALMKGVLYDDDALEAAWEVVRGWSAAELEMLQEEAAHSGLQARAGRFRIADHARELVGIGLEGLRRQAVCNSAGADETVYLERLAEDVRAGRNPANRIIDAWQGEWAGNIDRLVAYAAYQR